MNAKNAATLAGFGALTAAAAALGSKSTRESLYPWYASLRKPSFQPPRQAFGPVWSVLYSMIAYSGFRISNAKHGTRRTAALALWGAQLGANALWSVLFFGKRKPKTALIDLVSMEALIAATMAVSWRLDKAATLLLAPYSLWVAFAGVLNEEVYRLNPPTVFAAHP